MNGVSERKAVVVQWDSAVSSRCPFKKAKKGKDQQASCRDFQNPAADKVEKIDGDR